MIIMIVRMSTGTVIIITTTMTKMTTIDAVLI